MSGALAAVAFGGAAPIPPFHATTSLIGGSLFNVNGANGNIYTQGGAVISVSGSGGTPPYSFGVNLVKEGGSGSVFLVGAEDGVHNTVGYNLPNPGDSIAFHIEWSASDSSSPQKTDSGRDPSNAGQTYVIHRVS